MAWKIDLGRAVVYGLRDGVVERDPLEFLAGSEAADWDEHPGSLTPSGHMLNSFTCYLLHTDEHLVMIDTGFGVAVPPGMQAGAMPSELASLGFQPRDIDHVVFTHLHPDHVLGSLDSSRDPFFPDAVHWTLEREVDHWRSTDDPRAGKVLPVIEALSSAGVLNATEEPTPVAPGVDRIPTYGHSPGHTSIRLSFEDVSVVVTGDLTWSPVHLLHPEWTSPFDGDAAEAVTTRRRFIDDMASTGAPFLAGHHPQPGYGRLVMHEGDVRYEPLTVDDVRR